MRTYVLMLVAALWVPLALAIGYLVYTEARRAMAEEAATIRTLANVIAASTRRTLTANKESLELLAKRPLVQALDARKCDPILADFQELFPGFANLATIDLKGRVVCSAVPQPGGRPANISGTDWFRHALAEKKFIAGNPFVGPITGKWVSLLSVPIYRDRQEVKGFVGLPLELSTLDPDVPMAARPTGLRYGIVGGDGTMIWRNVDPDHLIGKNIGDSEVVRKILAIKNGSMEGVPADGEPRHFAVTSIPEFNWYVFVSVPTETIYAQAYSKSVRDVVLGLTVLLLVVMFALTVARRIQRPIQSIALAARRIREGDRKVRVSPEGPKEIVEVASEFNSMLDASQKSAQTLEESEHRYRSIFENANTGIASTDATGQVVSFNETFRAMLGYDADTLMRINYADITHPEDLAREIVLFNEVLARKRDSYRMEKRYIVGDGRVVWVDISSSAIHDKQGKVTNLVAVVEDITGRKLAEQEMRLASLVYRSSSEAMLVVDDQGIVITVNPAFTQITGYAPGDVIGKSPTVLGADRHDEAFYEAMQQSLLTTGTWRGEVWDRRKNGEVFPTWLTINASAGDDGSPVRYVALFSDITKQKESEALIWQQANFDTLTGLPNRRMLHDRLEQEIKKSHRHGQRLALMFLDLDRFKEVNDTLGHDMGDVLLKEAAKRLGSCVRESDTVARGGGDEFTVILSELGDAGGIDHVAQNILAKLAEPFQLGTEKVYISASIGVTLYPEDAETLDALLKNADQAMYAAKNQGRNRWSYFTPSMQEAAQARMRLAADLRGALAGNQLMVYYQPIVELATGAIYKAEALLRWQHPTRGMVNPAEFIPIAEDTGMIIEIGDWVFREAVAQAGQWRATHDPEFQITVNISPVQFRKGSNRHWFDYLQQHKLSGLSIAVEITEGLLLDASAAITWQLFEFRDAGIQVSLDDFGTGYSSLSYLKKFDIDFLKIDQSFVRNLAPASDDMALCEAIILMAHKLGIKVIAEGVETAVQRDLLAAAGCDYAQGYLYSRPVPPVELARLLVRR